MEDIDQGVYLIFEGETHEIMDTGIMFEHGTKSWLPTDIWNDIKDSMPDWRELTYKELLILGL